MKIQNINNAQNFKGLNFNNVCVSDREHFVKQSFKELKKIGEQYDIRLTSCYSNIPEYSSIDIDVKPLKKGLSFFKRIFRPIGKKIFFTENLYSSAEFKTKEEFLKAVNDAITDLNNKVNLHK